VNQDERRALYALEGGEVRQALTRAMLPAATVEVLIEWLLVGSRAEGVGRR
jgi:hypothetical protein